MTPTWKSKAPLRSAETIDRPIVSGTGFVVLAGTLAAADARLAPGLAIVSASTSS
jgi:hypothetical protein